MTSDHRLEPRLHDGKWLPLLGAVLCLHLLPVPSALAQMRVETGTYVGNGASSRSIAVGFHPNFVLLKGNTDEFPVASTSTMPGLVKELGKNTSLLSGVIPSLDPGGFTVSSDPRANASGIHYYWVAFSAFPGEMALNSYLGTGLDNVSITGAGFQPSYVIVMSSSGQDAMHRFPSQAGDASRTFQANDDKSDRIQAFESNGFQVGKHNTVNELGKVFHYVAFKAIPGRVGGDIYLGDGTDNRNITGLGFRPEFLLLSRRANGSPAIERLGIMSGDVTLPLIDTREFTNGIQTLLPDGFQVGTLDAVNRAADLYYWVAFRNPPAMDLALTKQVDETNPDEGDTLTYSVTITNNGPLAASGIEVLDKLPEGLTYLSYTPSQGFYDSGSGLWQLGGLSTGFQASLALRAKVNTGTGGSILQNIAVITSSDQADALPDNDADSVDVLVKVPPRSDLALDQAVTDSNPNEGDTLAYTITLENRGPNNATGITVKDLLPAGITYISSVATTGTYAHAPGDWNVGALAAGDSARLVIDVIVNDDAAGSTISNTAAVDRVDQQDPVSGNESRTVEILVQRPLLITALPQQSTPLLPGAAPREVLRLTLENQSARPETLTALSLINTTSGPGSVAERDAEWSSLSLVAVIPAQSEQILGLETLSGGRLVFDGLTVAIPAGEFVTFSVRGRASLLARDGDVLGLRLSGTSDLTFTRFVHLEPGGPLESLPAFPVDGMAAAQISVNAVASRNFTAGSEREVALDLVLPGNGYEPDVLERLDVLNLGDAASGADIEAMEIWADRGEPGYNPAEDLRFGLMEFTGQRWEITGLSEPVPRSGLRIFVTVNINALTTRVATIRLQVPSGVTFGIGMASGNSGPLDRPVSNPDPITISTLDKVVVSAYPLPSGTVRPGQKDVALASLVLTNTHEVQKNLVSLTVSSLVSGSGGTAELDGEFDRLDLYEDTNDDGLFDGPGVDRALATAVFVDRRARFGGFGAAIESGASRHFFIRGNISLHGAVDGDELALSVSGPLDLEFTTLTAVVGSWPVQSGARWVVDGMVAAQIAVLAGRTASVGPGDGPLPVLEIVVPRNGYKTDVLNGISIVNLGDADPADIALLRLWADGGDGLPDAGAGDDADLGVMTWTGSQWQSLSMAEPIGGSGLLLRAVMTLAGSFSDSAGSVRLAIPQNGILVASENDGPVDATVPSAHEYLLSSSPLLATLEISSTASTVGETVTIRMIVENQSSEPVDDIAPSALQPTGEGALTLMSGPAPATFSLNPASQDTFRWAYEAALPGTVRFTGQASGIGNVSNLPRGAVPATSPPHRIFIEAVELRLTPVESMPFSVNLGQTGIVPLSLTFTNPGGTGSSDIELTRLRLRVEDDAGNGIVPAQLFSRVVVSEGQEIYQDKIALEPSGADIDLSLGTSFSPVIVTSSEPTTLSLRFDIAAAASASKFRIVISNETSMEARDRNSGAPVTFMLEQGNYPIRSGVATILAPASEVQASSIPLPLGRAGPGQAGVPLLSFDLENIGTTGVTSAARVARFAIALTDTNGAPIADPSRILEQLEIRAGVNTHAVQPVIPSDGDSIVLVLSPINLMVGDTQRIDVFGTIAGAPDFVTFHTALREPSSFAVADASTGVPIAVTYPTGPISGPPIAIQRESRVLVVSGTPAFPAAITIGSRDVTAIVATLRHPGANGSAGILIRQLSIGCRDDRGQLVAPSSYLDAIRLRWNGVDAALVGALPSNPSLVPVTLPDLILEPGQSGQLDVLVDIDAGSPASHLQITVQGGDIRALDANIATQVEIQPESGQSLPLVSGLTQLETPPRLITVDLASTMPATAAPDNQWLHAGTIQLVNPTPGGAGAIAVRFLTLSASDRNFGPLSLGALVKDVALLRNGAVVAGVTELTADSVSALLAFPNSLTVDPLSTVNLEIRLRLQDPPQGDGFRVGINSNGIQVQQPSGALLAIEVRPAAGRNFPMWTETVSFSSASLDESYSNFPNPFAAGRENTTFAFYLPTPGRVTLRIWTPRGEEVCTLIDAEARPAGLYQSDRWDGRNGRGSSVVNGVYVAELEVQFDDGENRRLLRKIGVKR